MNSSAVATLLTLSLRTGAVAIKRRPKSSFRNDLLSFQPTKPSQSSNAYHKEHKANGNVNGPGNSFTDQTIEQPAGAHDNPPVQRCAKYGEQAQQDEHYARDCTAHE